MTQQLKSRKIGKILAGLSVQNNEAKVRLILTVANLCVEIRVKFQLQILCS